MPTSDLILLHAPSVYDFRSESILYGPVSDLVPSTPVFEMYPIGFATMSEYLHRFGLNVRIVNLAVRMLDDPKFDVEKYLRGLDSIAFGIDLHWLPHAHGSIEIARLVKKLHPSRPIIFGGFSSSYYYKELIQYPAVDFILRGDSTEQPLLALIQFLKKGGVPHPASGSVEFNKLVSIPNVVWKDSENNPQTNPITNIPDTLDHLSLDYSNIVQSVVRYLDIASYKPFHNWLNYPITAALSVRGCRYNCVTCGGSANAFRSIHNRGFPAYRSPEKLAEDVHRIGRFSRAPVFVLGDIRQPGDDYADRFLSAIAGIKKPVYFELFNAAPREFFAKMAHSIPDFTIEISIESHDERVRRAFGRPYTNADLEKTIDYALDAGCQRLDLFSMTGIKEQTYDSVMGTVDYSKKILERYAHSGETRVIPFISPLAPFVDPGSRAFEEPEKNGYRLFCRSLEDHRKALLAPSWKYVLNYETEWMNRDQIVNSTYEAGLRLNRMKGDFGVISSDYAEATEKRILNARQLVNEVDRIISEQPDPDRRKQELRVLKEKVDQANISTVCDKRELETPMKGLKIDIANSALVVLDGVWKDSLRIVQSLGNNFRNKEQDQKIDQVD
jgi:B12-binding domain/radical SAM domain protein